MKLSPSLKALLDGNVRMKPKQRRQFVREFVDDVQEHCQRPSKRVIDVLCNRLVIQHPSLVEKLTGKSSALDAMRL